MLRLESEYMQLNILTQQLHCIVISLVLTSMVQQWLVLRWQRVGRRRWNESANKVGHPTSVEWIPVFPAFALQVGVPRHINMLVGGQIHHAQLSVIHAHATAK